MLKGGVCIFVNNSINYSSLNLETYSTDLEICSIQLNLLSKKFYILNIYIYRSPSGKCSKFMMDLEHILQMFYNPKMDFIIYGDINLNYLEETNKVKQLNILFKTFNLISTVTFPTRICTSTSTAIDNIFIDISKYDYHSVSPLHNELFTYY
jgi:hypothetical protein